MINLRPIADFFPLQFHYERQIGLVLFFLSFDYKRRLVFLKSSNGVLLISGQRCYLSEQEHDNSHKSFHMFHCLIAR